MSAKPAGPAAFFTEPWSVTALPTGLVALAIGIGAGVIRRQISVVPSVTLTALWFTLGGHLVDLAFRNYLGRLAGGGAVRALSRLAWWFAGGCVLYQGALETKSLIWGRDSAGWPWWYAGVGFVGAELVVHLLMRSRQLPSFYDGRG
jgi:hypothetical protein